ncbi:related to SEC5 protein [Phialocephala subalpina]|uniref:Exocyst complex component SEC5 n=1 Tax=Phialocephala subalpina TaxID=576137 RepID=A0A1L7XAZ8_9HELO|nr:related to SEC5 protein [Phialocephala subalpina]
MTDYERTVLEHYQLSTAYPVEWPADKDNSDASDEEEETKPNRNGMMRRSKSRYSALERVASDRKSFLPGSQRGENGVDTMVQRDEPDPLGSTDSVVRILRQMGLPVQEDPRVRNRFLLSSTTFSPALFLSQVHSTASTQQLLDGLDVLSRSIDQKSASLKVLVESNFERFVRAKATIDNVYKEMKYRGAEPPPPSPSRRPHSRHASRNSFRTSSGNQTSIMIAPIPDAKKKNALTKESEYGVLGIKTPLLDVSAKAEEVWGPALGGRDKEDSLKTMTGTVERYKELYEVGQAITDSVKRKDYESIVEEYTKAKRYADDARKLAENLGSTPPTDSQIVQMLIAGRVWHDVEEQIEDFKRDVWRRLIALQNTSKSEAIGGGPQDQHMELISVLLELGVTDNPIWVWLLSRYDHLKSKIQTTSDRSKIEIEILRRRLANGERPTPQIIASHLRSLGRQTAEDKPTSVDSSEVIELWEKMHAFLSDMLGSQGILGEVVEFWQTVQSFIDGKAQISLPVGINGESRQWHRLSDQGTLDLQNGTVELIDKLRESIFSFFVDPPIDDISALFSPMPPTPKTPASALNGNGNGQLTPSALRDPRFNYDANNLPPPSPKRGEAWEKHGFWPPWSNSLSGVHYLGKLLVLVGTGASEMAAISPVGSGDGAALDRLKAFVGEARERCVIAICAAWNQDATNIKVLEDWRRSPEKRDLTRMPSYFGSFESAILTGMQKILYISEAKSGSTGVVFPPPAKLLQMVRSQFVTTLYKSLSGMVENAEKSVKKADDDWTTDNDGLASPVAMVIATSIGAGTVNASDRNVRMLLTLSNLHALRNDIVPNLTKQFEDAFAVKLTEETKTIKDVLGQIDARLFTSYTRPSVEALKSIIKSGIASPTWSPRPNEKPQEVRPYVYDSLLSLVLVHTQVSTTASSLTVQMLSYLLEKTSESLLEAFRLRPKYTLSELMQATLDVEFVAQTLSQYTTDRASESQSSIYQELDRKTDNDARTRLQSELPEMRKTLKGLREGSRSEFACFRKVRTRAPGQARDGGRERESSASTQGGQGPVQNGGQGQMI